MYRRSMVVSSGVIAGSILGGCLSRGGDQDSENDESETSDRWNESEEVEPIEIPDKPENITSQDAEEFVQEYEEATRHNRPLNRSNNEDKKIIRISVSCDSWIEIETDDEYYIPGYCSGSITTIWKDDGSKSVGDIGFDSFFYYTSEDEQIKMDDWYTVSANETYGENDTYTTGFQIVNFSNTSQNTSVMIIDPDESGDEPFFEETYTVPSRYWYRVQSVLSKKGNYELSVELDNGSNSSFDWNIEDLKREYSANIYISPNKSIKLGSSNEGPSFL